MAVTTIDLINYKTKISSLLYFEDMSYSINAKFVLDFSVIPSFDKNDFHYFLDSHNDGIVISGSIVYTLINNVAIKSSQKNYDNT